MNSPTTDELLKELLTAKDLDTFLAANRDKQVKISLSEYLGALLKQKNREKADVIRDSALDTIYGYQIFQGKKSPSREKLLQLAFGFPLNIQETQKLLHVAQAGELYVKNRRDSIIIFALESRMSLMEVNDLLDTENENTIGSK